MWVGKCGHLSVYLTADGGGGLASAEKSSLSINIQRWFALSPLLPRVLVGAFVGAVAVSSSDSGRLSIDAPFFGRLQLPFVYLLCLFLGFRGFLWTGRCLSSRFSSVGGSSWSMAVLVPFLAIFCSDRGLGFRFARGLVLFSDFPRFGVTDRGDFPGYRLHRWP